MSSGTEAAMEGDSFLVEDVTIFDKMRVEVFDREKRPLFEASLEKITDRLAVLHCSTEVFQPDTVEEMETGEEPALVTARGFYAPRNIGVYIQGWLSPLPHGQSKQWMFQDVQVKGTDQGRAHYRTPLKASGWTAPVPDGADAPGLPGTEPTEDGPWTPCAITNASAGGARFRTEAALEPGSRVWLRFKLRRGREQPPLTCEVCSAMEREGSYEYGCKFVDRSPKVDDVIVRTMIELQIMQA